MIETHELFPKRTNVEFIEVMGPERLKMRVWERGAGETMACGTGASAAAVDEQEILSVFPLFAPLSMEISCQNRRP